MRRAGKLFVTGLCGCFVVISGAGQVHAAESAKATRTAAATTSTVAGSVTASNLRPLGELIAARQGKFQAVTTSELEKRRQDAIAAVGALGQRLARGTAENTQRWHRFLEWDRLQAGLTADSGQARDELQASLGRFYRNEKGLELPEFLAARTAVQRYLNGLQATSESGAAQRHDQVLTQLAELLPQYEAEPSGERAERLGQLLGWLTQTDQATDVVRGMHERFWHPNLSVRVSETLVAAGISEVVNDTSPLRDVILGTTLRGTAHTKGMISAELAPANDFGLLRIALRGTTLSDNVGWNRGVTIYSQGTTEVSAYKAVQLTDRGLVPLAANAHCDTDSTISDIRAKCALITRMAWKRAGRSKSQAEAIASRHAEARVAERMDDRASEFLGKAQESYREKFRHPLLRRGEFPRQLLFRTTEDQLAVDLLQANDSQLAAPTPTPSFAAKTDLAVRLHESFVANFSRAMIGGLTLTDERVAELVKDLTGEVPEELQVTQDKEPWSITFSPTQPVNASFSTNIVRFAIRGRRFTQGDRVIQDLIELSATYALERTPQGVKLTRQGDVSVEYLRERGTLSPAQIGLRTLLRRKFEALFTPEIIGEGLKLPGRWEKAGTLSLAEMQADAGWLSLGWLLPPPAAKLAQK